MGLQIVLPERVIIVVCQEWFVIYKLGLPEWVAI